jgi:hypothetical protein
VAHYGAGMLQVRDPHNGVLRSAFRLLEDKHEWVAAGLPPSQAACCWPACCCERRSKPAAGLQLCAAR